MTEQHRARPEQWATQEAFRDADYAASCLLELRDRVLAMHACVCDIYKQLDRLKAGHESNWARIVKLEEGPAGPVATDDELCDLYDETHDTRPNSLRAVYNLGRQHAAAAQLTSQNPQ